MTPTEQGNQRGTFNLGGGRLHWWLSLCGPFRGLRDKYPPAICGLGETNTHLEYLFSSFLPFFVSSSFVTSWYILALTSHSNSGEGRRFIGIVCPGADLYAVPETSTCSIGVSGSSSPVDRAGKPTRHHSRGRSDICCCDVCPGADLYVVLGISTCSIGTGKPTRALNLSFRFSYCFLPSSGLLSREIIEVRPIHE